MNYKKGLERNLWLYALLRVFHKRTYLAVIIIYVTVYAGLSVEQFGVIAAIAALASMVLEIPSGYISDKLGHKKAIIFGSFLIMIAPLGFILYPNFYGVLFATVVFYAGGSFHSGTMQAFLHETLIELGRDDEFGKVAARAQRWGLFGNIFLVALVPLTYSIDPRLPFVVGFILQSMGFIVSLFFTTPRKEHKKINEKIHDGFFALLKSVNHRGEILLFFFLGLVTALYNKFPEFKELYFQDIGVPMWFFGFVYSLMGIAGIILTYHVHKLEKYEAKTFYLADFLFVCTISILVGLISNVFFAVGIFILYGGYGRIRRILVHAHLLKNCPTQNLKATYLSMYSFFEAFNAIWVPLILGYAIGRFGAQQGYMFFGIGFFVLLSGLYLYIFRKK
ncbi:MAG: MFS transporter [Candidatus Moraniibacteriota bacterium]|jgi:MFS family permease